MRMYAFLVREATIEKGEFSQTSKIFAKIEQKYVFVRESSV